MVKRFFVVAILVLGVGAAALWGYERLSWQKAHRNVLDAYKRAYEYREAGTLIYEPRFKDLETSMDQLEQLPLLNENSVAEKEHLRLCIDKLDNYRRVLLAGEESSSIEAINAAVKLEAEARRDLDGCVVSD